MRRSPIRGGRLAEPLSLPGDVETFRYVPKSLNVHGGYIALAFGASPGSGAVQLSRVLTSGDDGEHFSEASDLRGSHGGWRSLYVVSPEDLWAAARRGRSQDVWLLRPTAAPSSRRCRNPPGTTNPLGEHRRHVRLPPW